METKSVNVNLSGMFTTLLAVLFIGLKLGGVIDWSWVWVLAPLWIPIAIFLVFAGIFLVIVIAKDE